jgi:hypothetical protein
MLLLSFTVWFRVDATTSHVENCNFVYFNDNGVYLLDELVEDKGTIRWIPNDFKVFIPYRQLIKVKKK